MQLPLRDDRNSNAARSPFDCAVSEILPPPTPLPLHKTKCGSMTPSAACRDTLLRSLLRLQGPKALLCTFWLTDNHCFALRNIWRPFWAVWDRRADLLSKEWQVARRSRQSCNCCVGDITLESVWIDRLLDTEDKPRAGSRVVRIDPLRFPGRMSYKATKPGLVLFYILACFNCVIVYYRALFMYC